jgi:HK97 family phage prohead protease
MERKTLEFKLTKFDFEGRTLEGYAAAFNNVDLGGDVIHKGAFTKTLAERGNKVKFLWQHDPGEPIGRPLFLQEDENGLFVKAIISPTARGNDALALLKDKAIDGLSIGYDAVKGGTEFERAADGETVRNLKEIKLYEFSLVTFPMNESATVTGLKGASGKTDLPIAARDRPWDASAAVDRVRSETGSVDAPSESYRDAFFWFDADNPDIFGSYKLPFADAIGGDLTAVPRGIFAGAQRLDDADIPEADKERIRGKMDTYYARMSEQFDDESIVPPWEKAEKRYILSVKNEDFNQAELAEIAERFDEWVTGNDPTLVIGGDFEIVDFPPTKSENTKAGRVLSARNASRINTAIASLIEALDSAGIELEGFTRTPTVQEPGKSSEQEFETIKTLIELGVLPPYPKKGHTTTDVEAMNEIINAHLTALANDLMQLYGPTAIEPAPADEEQAARDDDEKRAGPVEPPTLEIDRLKLLLEMETQI